MAFTLVSPAFAHGEALPKKHARDGQNLFPPLTWSGAPATARSFALIVEDPDAPGGIFYHCAVYNIPPDRTDLPQAVDTAPDPVLRYGRNDFDALRYDGPEPPRGHGVHHYHFRLFALDVPGITTPGQAGVGAIAAEARKHAIAQAEIVATYER